MEPAQQAEEKQRYLSRAREGVERLEMILHRMREATRLEQLLQEIEPERFNLSELLNMARENYATAFPHARFELELPADPIHLNGAPELISQALDKLVNNALDFHTPDTPIRLALSATEAGHAKLSVINQGPPLPQKMEQELFSSMISVREPKEKTEEPHLGLGLYLVRLICEFHGGRAEAANLEGEQGVRFSLLLPAETAPPAV
jgi:signal transduction histidine kinase